MKSLLTILLICFCFVGYGQTVTIDSLGHKTTYSADSVYGTIRWRGILPLTTPTPKYDTVRVIMLVCDTSNHSTQILEVYKTNNSSGGFISTNPTVWQYGYSVREIHNEQEGNIDWYFDHTRPPKDYGVHKYYLDANMKPIKDNIIVWQSIIISKTKTQ